MVQPVVELVFSILTLGPMDQTESAVEQVIQDEITIEEKRYKIETWKAFEYNDNEDNKLLRKFLIRWEETYYEAKKDMAAASNMNTEVADVSKSSTSKEEKVKNIFGRKVYDFKTKKFVKSENKIKQLLEENKKALKIKRFSKELAEK